MPEPLTPLSEFRAFFKSCPWDGKVLMVAFFAFALAMLYRVVMVFV